MINLLVEGKILDLPPVNLSYKRVNNAFTFGKLTLSRSQSFKVPKTPNNLNIFNLGNIWQFGESERRYFDAQLQGSGFVENGLLYIESIDEDYNCVFLFGSLFILKNVSNVKKMADVLEPYDVLLPAPQIGKNANALDLVFFDTVKYINNTISARGLYNMPSISVKDLFRYANEIFGNIFDVSAIPNYRIVAQNNEEVKKENVIFAKNSVNSYADNQNLKLIVREFGGINSYSESGVRGNTVSQSIRRYFNYTYNDVELTFPEDFPDDVFCIDNQNYEDSQGFVTIDLEFFGDYSFNTDVRAVSSLAEEGVRNSIGQPLAGRTIKIPGQTSFSFYSKNNFHNTTNREGENTYYNHYRGFFGGDASPFSYTFPEARIKYDDWHIISYEGTRWVSAVQSLPSISFIELLKSVAILADKYVTYNSASHKIELVNYADINELIELKNVVSMDKVNRVGITEARSNKITPAYNKGVSVNNVNIINYITDNATLEAEEVIKELKVSTGNNINGTIYIDDLVKNGNLYELLTDVPLIAEVGEGENLQFIKMQKNELLNSIYEKSTRIEVNCMMTMAEFMTIKETNVFVYKSLKWVWTSGQWQKNRAKFVLQKI